jgi:hypothetical protein
LGEARKSCDFLASKNLKKLNLHGTISIKKAVDFIKKSTAFFKFNNGNIMFYSAKG